MKRGSRPAPTTTYMYTYMRHVHVHAHVHGHVVVQVAGHSRRQHLDLHHPLEESRVRLAPPRSARTRACARSKHVTPRPLSQPRGQTL
eukprot:366383-Prymnesium_polylepis.2